MIPRRALVGASAALTVLMLLGCAPGVSNRAGVLPPPSDHGRNRAARHDLANARQLRDEGKLEAAAHWTERGLSAEPTDAELAADLHRLRSELLRELGQPQLASQHAARASALFPVLSPPPNQPLLESATGIEIVVLPPLPGEGRRRSSLDEWPEGVAAETLRERLQTRLPGASISWVESAQHPTSQSVPAARSFLEARKPRAVLSLRIDRAFCAETTDLGPFSLVWVRVAEAGGKTTHTPEILRFSENANQLPMHAGGCAGSAVSLAIERVLAGPAFQSALTAAAETDSARWNSKTMRDLFPALNVRLAAALESGRLLLEEGQLEAARDRFAEAVAIDPDDLDARAYHAEAAQSLAIASQLDALSGREQTGRLEAQLTPEARRRVESRIAEQQRERDRMLVALAIVEGEPNLPASFGAQQLHPADIPDPNATGPSLARQKSGDVIEARNLYAPDGDVLARYYVTAGEDLPILREEDTRGDGSPDRWTAYRDLERSEVWEDQTGNGKVDRHLFYAEGGERLTRVEMATKSDGRFDRVLRYENGVPRSELRDSDGDGSFDITDWLDDAGHLTIRDEDRNGDGAVDIRSFYSEGRLKSREILDPALASELRRKRGL